MRTLQTYIPSHIVFEMLRSVRCQRECLSVKRTCSGWTSEFRIAKLGFKIPAATRSRHGRTTDTLLAAGAPAHHVQVVRIDARCSLWLRADISPGRRRATLDNAGKSASAVGGQRTIWRAMGVNIGWSQSFLRRRSISLESTTCISSQHELYRNFQASS